MAHSGEAIIQYHFTQKCPALVGFIYLRDLKHVDDWDNGKISDEEFVKNTRPEALKIINRCAEMRA